MCNCSMCFSIGRHELITPSSFLHFLLLAWSSMCNLSLCNCSIYFSIGRQCRYPYLRKIIFVFVLFLRRLSHSQADNKTMCKNKNLHEADVLQMRFWFPLFLVYVAFVYAAFVYAAGDQSISSWSIHKIGWSVSLNFSKTGDLGRHGRRKLSVWWRTDGQTDRRIDG